LRMYAVSWFSAGVSSAVATRLAIESVDEIIYTHIEDQHPDTLRFVKDCESWFGKSITILQSPYKSVENAVRGAGGRGYINGPVGAPCRRFLKKRVRKEWETDHADLFPLRYVWGMDAGERDRAERLRETMPEFEHSFPLIERGIGKSEAHEILAASGIKRPAMYELGYHNNNCVGCVKGGIGYWNKIRVDFPDVFSARAKLERDVGASMLKTKPPKGEKAKPIFLDELDPDAGRHEGPICDDCGIMCELQAIEPAHDERKRQMERRNQ
jgi:hypothetical protein